MWYCFFKWKYAISILWFQSCFYLNICKIYIMTEPAKKKIWKVLLVIRFYIYICLITDIHLLLINYKYFYNVIQNLFKSIIGWNEFGTWNSSLAVKTVNKKSIICIDIQETKMISEHVCSQGSYKLFHKIDLWGHDIVIEILNYIIWDFG